MTKASRWMTTQQTADLLGVKAETVYAYVSRGVLARQRGEDRRSSRFDRIEVERLAERNRRGGRAGSLEVVIDSELTLLDPAGALFYRGYDAVELARTCRFEDVAELLWDVGAEPARPRRATGRMSYDRAWQVASSTLRTGRRAQSALPTSASATDRMRVVVAALAGCDPSRHDRRTQAVTGVARGLIAGAVDCLPELSTPRGHSIAERLWSRLSERQPGRGEIRALEAALILLADHELAASTLAARIAASVWADPYLVVLTGLGAAGGLLHGAAASAVETFLRTADNDLADGVRLVVDRLHRREALPGFGHAVYTGRDPRADALLDQVGRAGRRGRTDASIAAMLDEVRRHGGPAPNADFALGALVVKAGLTPGSGEAIFLLARMAGMIAHALEEYPHRLRFRPRALYTGRSPV